MAYFITMLHRHFKPDSPETPYKKNDSAFLNFIFINYSFAALHQCKKDFFPRLKNRTPPPGCWKCAMCLLFLSTSVGNQKFCFFLFSAWSWLQSGINTDGAHNFPTSRRVQKGDILSLNCFPIISGLVNLTVRCLINFENRP